MFRADCCLQLKGNRILYCIEPNKLSNYVLIEPQYVFSNPLSNHILSLLTTDPPTPELALGTSSKLPPTPETLQENPKFMPIVQSIIAEHAHNDPMVQSQAQVMASAAGANLGSGGVFFAPPSKRKRPGYGGGGGTGGDSAGGASTQGGMGSGGRGGWIHVSDLRHPPGKLSSRAR